MLPALQLPACKELLQGPGAFRERVVNDLRMGGAAVSYEAVKRLLLVLNYGGAAEWQRQHGVRALPPAVPALERELQ